MDERHRMRNQDTFSKTLYVVAWASCTIPLSGRSFEDEDEAILMAHAWKDADGLRIERMRAAFVFDTRYNKQNLEKKFQELGKSSADVL